MTVATEQVRAIDPEVVLEWEYQGVVYKYVQPAGTFMALTQRDHGNQLIDACVQEAVNLVGAAELREKGYAWSKIIPQPHANRLYLALLAAGSVTEAEAEG